MDIMINDMLDQYDIDRSGDYYQLSATHHIIVYSLFTRYCALQELLIRMSSAKCYRMPHGPPCIPLRSYIMRRKRRSYLTKS